MKLVPALEYEKLRTDKESWCKMMLHKDGKFYHVYEWSAWLLKMFVCTEELQVRRGDNKILQVMRYKTKNCEYAMYGFPVESLSKYVPVYKEVEQTDDGDMLFDIEIPFSDMSQEAVEQAFEQWKASCPESETKQHKKSGMGVSQASAVARSGVFQILSKVLSYPLARSTPSQNIEFISDLKQEVASLL